MDAITALRLIAEIDGPLPAGSSQDWRRRVQLIAKQALQIQGESNGTIVTVDIVVGDVSDAATTSD